VNLWFVHNAFVPAGERCRPHGEGAIMKYNERNKNKSLWKAAGIGALVLVFGVAGLPASAQQNQGNLPGYPVASGQQAQNSTNDVPQESNPAPAPPSQMAAPQDSVPPNAAPANQPLPSELTLPAGTIVQVRTNEWISTSRNLPGDGFNATLAQPIVVNGWVVAQRGQSVLGRVTMVQKNHGTTQLGLQLSELTFVDGQLLPIQTQLARSSAGSDPGRNVGVVGSTTATGAVIGAIAAGGQGAAVGAGIGAIAGLGVITTHGKPTVIPPETLLTFQLQAPVTISTEKSRVAFHPAGQADYSAGVNSQRSQRFTREGAYGTYPPPPPPAYYGYPYAYDPYFYPYGGWGFYPGPLYLGFGFGRGYYGGFRGRFR
jgi:hypothetical protein